MSNSPGKVGKVRIQKRTFTCCLRRLHFKTEYVDGRARFTLTGATNKLLSRKDSIASPGVQCISIGPFIRSKGFKCSILNASHRFLVFVLSQAYRRRNNATRTCACKGAYPSTSTSHMLDRIRWYCEVNESLSRRAQTLFPSVDRSVQDSYINIPKCISLFDDHFVKNTLV